MDMQDLFYRDLGKWVENHISDDDEGDDHNWFYRAAQNIAESWFHAKDMCQSPIETMLLEKLVFAIDGYELVRLQGENEPLAEGAFGTWFLPQAQIGRYRVDFLLTSVAKGHIRRTVIECDGHDFHERTKEQARRDKARDRFMVAEGITVLRFAGSEIYQNADACLEQIEAVLSNAIESALAAAGLVRRRKDRP